jgi:hypothetical protein
MKKVLFCTICKKVLKGKQRIFCSAQCKNKQHQYYLNRQKRGLARKLELVVKAGGKCSACGYSENLAALTFHHMDPKEKKFKLDLRSLSNRTLQSAFSELSKCVLVCSNCHAELHNPELTLSRLLHP